MIINAISETRKPLNSMVFTQKKIVYFRTDYVLYYSGDISMSNIQNILPNIEDASLYQNNERYILQGIGRFVTDELPPHMNQIKNVRSVTITSGACRLFVTDELPPHVNQIKNVKASQ